MKVTGGKAKGRILAAPKSGCIRITTDRVKESLFDILGPLEGLKFLDLFAGSGNVGIEAASRGAERVTFVEKRRTHIETIKKNLARCGLGNGCDILALPVEKAVSLLKDRQERFDIIFADPPYERGLTERLLELLDANDILAKGGLLVIEHSIREECPERGTFLLTDRRRYGDTALAFFIDNLNDGGEPLPVKR